MQQTHNGNEYRNGTRNRYADLKQIYKALQKWKHLKREYLEISETIKKEGEKMIRIKASYSNMRELEKMVKVLKPYIASYTVKPQKGKYKRVYIDIDVNK